MNMRISAVTSATVLALAPFALAMNDDDPQKRIKELERQLEEITKTVKSLQDQQARSASADDLDRAIADLANRIEARGMTSKGGANVSAPDVRALTIRFEERFRGEYYGDRTFGAKKNDPISPSPLTTNISPFSPNGNVFGSFIGGAGQNEMSDDSNRLLNRLRININVDVDNDLDAFFQLQHSQIWGTPIGNGGAAGGSLLPNAPSTQLVSPVPPASLGEQLQSPAAAGAIGFKQAYVRMKNVYEGLDVWLGRFTLDLGKGRILSSADWDNVGRSFDGLRLEWRNDQNNISATAFATKVVQGALDFQNQDTNMLGGWVNISPTKEIKLTPYTLWVDDNTSSATAMIGKPWTIGALGEVNLLDSGFVLNGEIALQQDHDRPNTPVQGAKTVDFGEAYFWSVGAEFGIPFEKEKYHPLVGIEVTEGSKLFNDLFGSRHGLYGQADVVTSLNNLRQWKLYAAVTPCEKLEVGAAFYFFRLTRQAAEGVFGQSPVSKNLGQELDVYLNHKCTDHVTVSAGYSHFFNGYALQEGAFSPGASYATASSRSADERRDSDTIFVQIGVAF